MRISTAQYFESSAASYSKNYSDVVKSQEEAASGIRVNSGADDPVGAARLLQLDQQAAMLKQYSGNITTVRNTLGSSESVLTSISQVLQRARELAIGAGNGNYTDADRQANAAELGQIEEQLVSLMNSRDQNGQYLFSGSNSSVAPYAKNADGTYSYNGDQTTLSLQVGDTQWMATNDTGFSIFEQAINTSRSQVTAIADGNVANDGRFALSNGQVSNSALFNNRFRSGEPYTVSIEAGSQLKILDRNKNDVTADATENGQFSSTSSSAQTISFRGVDLSLNVNLPTGETDANLVGLSFELGAKSDSFSSTRSPSNGSTAVVTDSAIIDQKAYQSTFPSGSAVIKFKGTAPDPVTYDLYSAPLTANSKPVLADQAVDGGSVSAAGVKFTLSGTPAAGDQFNVAVNTHQSQNVLDTISQLRTALNAPANTLAEQQAFQASLASGIANLASGHDQLTTAISAIGARGAALDTQSDTNLSLQTANTSTTASIRDTDPAEVLVRLNLQQTMLQASQLAFSKISQLSLFDRL